MKYVIIIGDGMADIPIPSLGNKTPLMAAVKPSIDSIARKGQTGLFRTIEDDMPTGSAVANLAVLGYDPRKDFQGRGVLEAASLGITLSDSDMAMRANLICVENDRIRSHSSGHITDEEASILIKDLCEHFSTYNINLYQGLSYRHVLVIPEGDPGIECFPPHDHLDQDIKNMLIRPLTPEAGATAGLLNKLITESRDFLGSHQVNINREANGLQPANTLWPWSPGTKPAMKTFEERFGLSGAAISAVDLIKGIAVYAGLDVIEVEGATGLHDTNYEGKADACLDALEDHDFVLVHVEAADEAGHEKNAELKVQCIEDLSERLVKHILKGIKKRSIESVVAILPDHPTPVECGAHTRDPVPVAIWNPGVGSDTVETFDEESVKSGSLGLLTGDQFIKKVFSF